MKYLQIIAAVLGFIIVFFCMGCGGTRVPLYTNPQFQANPVSEITLLPTLDLRLNKNLSLDFRTLDKQIKKGLSKRDYQTQLSEDTTVVSGLNAEALNASPAVWLSSLKTSGAKHVMVVYVDSTSSRTQMNSMQQQSATGNISSKSVFFRLTGYLFDCETQTLVWKDTFKLSCESDGFNSTVTYIMSNSLLKSLPKLGKNFAPSKP